MEPFELLKRNLAIEPDLQNFIGFVPGCVNKLGRSLFAFPIVSLNLMQRLRDAGAVTGFRLPASLLSQGHELRVAWDEHAEPTRITRFARPPNSEAVARLRRHLDVLARTIQAINVKLTRVHEPPSATFALTQFMHEKPAFETALDISGWQ